MSKMLPIILREILSTAVEKLGALLAKLPLQRRLEADNYANFSVLEEVLLQAVVESDKLLSISQQELNFSSFSNIRCQVLDFCRHWERSQLTSRENYDKNEEGKKPPCYFLKQN
jgi:hypothetical protein